MTHRGSLDRHATLDVRPDEATVRFVNQAGQVIHEFGVAPQ